MLSNDGKYEIYIIQHRKITKEQREWDNSGGCEQLIPKEIIKEQYDELFYSDNAPFKPFSANGSCWQKTGVHGSFKERNAEIIMNHLISWNPNHEFRICKVTIEQKTEEVGRGHYLI